MAMRTMADVFAVVGDIVMQEPMPQEEIEYENNIRREALGLNVLGASESADTSTMIEQLLFEQAVLIKAIDDGAATADEVSVTAEILAQTASAIHQLQTAGSFAIVGAPKGLYARRALMRLSQVSVENRLFKRVTRGMTPAAVAQFAVDFRLASLCQCRRPRLGNHQF